MSYKDPWRTLLLIDLFLNDIDDEYSIEGIVDEPFICQNELLVACNINSLMLCDGWILKECAQVAQEVGFGIRQR